MRVDFDVDAAHVVVDERRSGVTNDDDDIDFEFFPHRVDDARGVADARASGDAVANGVIARAVASSGVRRRARARACDDDSARRQSF